MALYLMLSKLTERGRARVKSAPDRILEVNKEVEEKGARVVAQYALMGAYDFATVLEASDNWNMLRLAMDLGARGTIETSTFPALRIDDFIAFMKAEPVEQHWREEADVHPEREHRGR
ncbi:MAG: GYD domain-containing protein [Chloroflexi bacterium]|nr:GYD domain-containing protein [Chloroflexota bacterium]